MKCFRPDKLIQSTNSFANTAFGIDLAVASEFDLGRLVTDEIQAKYFDPKGAKIATRIEPAGPWYDAEDYHQEYLFNNPNGYQCPTHRLHW